MSCNGDCNQGRECDCECKKETKMTKHKWHDEIVAWAGGADIEYKQYQFGEWTLMRHGLAMFDDDSFQFRIKPQPKQKKYLHIIFQPNGSITLRTQPVFCGEEEYFGKIEVQDD